MGQSVLGLPTVESENTGLIWTLNLDAEGVNVERNGEGCPFLSRLGGLESVVSSPSRVYSKAAAEN